MIVSNQHPVLLFVEGRFRGTKRRVRLDVYDAAGPARWGLCLFDPVTDLCCRRRGSPVHSRGSLCPMPAMGTACLHTALTSLLGRPDTQWRNILERGTGSYLGSTLGRVRTAPATQAMPSTGDKSPPTAVGDDSTGIFPAGQKLPPVAQGQDMAFLGALSSRRGTEASARMEPS